MLYYLFMTYEELEEDLRKRIKAEGHGAQTRLAEHLGVERSHVGRFMTGERNLSHKYITPTLKFLGLELTVREKGAGDE